MTGMRTKTRSLSALLAASSAVLFQVAACGSSDCSETRSCGEWDGSGARAGNASGGHHFAGSGGAAGSEEAGASSGGVAGGAPPSGNAGAAGDVNAAGSGGAPVPACDTSKSPSTEACIVNDEYAVFVAPSGRQDAEGTRAEPLLSIRAAITRASEQNKVVIVCNAEYDEALTIGSGARVYGGFACPDSKSSAAWAYQAGSRPVIVPSTPRSALTIEDVADPIVLEDLEFEALDATAPGESSIGAIVVNASSVQLTRVSISARSGAAGADGESGDPGDDGVAAGSAQRGHAAVCGASAPVVQAGGSWPASVCGSRGGPGGVGNFETDGSPGIQGSPQENVVAADGKGGAPDTTGGAGKPGSAGTPGSTAVASKASGTFTPAGYTPHVPSHGGDGYPGQGGGGGGASHASGNMCTGASGGAGGLGGCGGKGGQGGQGGGASIALLSWSSQITLQDCDLRSGSGGKGGKGGAGGPGGEGASGAEGGLGTSDLSIGRGGSGGPGGDGGPGGAGAGGHGGPSYALVFHDGPVSDAGGNTWISGPGGERGSGGGSGARQAPNGNAGASEQEFEVD